MPGEGPPPTRPVDDYGNDAYHRRFMQASRDQHRRVTDDRHRAIEDDYNRARGIGAHDQALEVRDFYSRFPETRRIGVQG